MSKTVDERVVSMQFDNQQFEKNVKTSIDTINKLNKSLDLKGASKGLNEVNAAAKRVDMSGLSNNVETVRTRFSSLQVMAVTALANIANSAVNTGKRIVSAFTLDPIISGFQEYETQINAVQTILANTQSKGTTLDDVNEALDTLNTYADKTIYNFTEMTRNIGTFTAAGIDLETSTNAIQGIANLAAVSGSNAQQASTAMYQLSQALASGTVKLMDWNSVVNAGMGGQVFQDALKETARVHDIAIDDMIKKEGSFRETLKNGWLTSEILTETLQKFTLTTEGLTDAQIQQNREMLKSKGYTDEQIDKIFELGKTATDAATKVKTFTQLMDTLKEAAQSGWTQTWELLVGDFDEAKSLFTELSDLFGNMISESADSRNSLLEGALTSNWDKLIKSINDAGIETSVFEEKLKTTLKDNGYDVEKLTEKYGSLKEVFRSGAAPADLLNKSLEVLKSATSETENLSRKFDNLIGSITKKGGRELLIESFRNALNGLLKIFENIKLAWRDVFPKTTSDQLYRIIESIHEFSEKLNISKSTAEDLRKTFRGLFAVLDIIFTITKEITKGVISLLSNLKGVKDRLLEATASFGVWIDGVRKSAKETGIFGYAVGKVVGFIQKCIDKIKEFFSSINKGISSNGSNRLLKVFETIWEVIKKISGWLAEAGSKIASIIGNAFRNGDFSILLDIFNTGVFSAILLGVNKFINKLTRMFDGATSMLKGVKSILDGVRGCLEAYQTNLKADVLLKIAVAIGILAVSLLTISNIDQDKLLSSLIAISSLFGILITAFKVFNKVVNSGFNEKDSLMTVIKKRIGGGNGVNNALKSMIAMSAAVLILSKAVATMGKLSWDELARGLVGMTVALAALIGALKIIPKDTSVKSVGLIGMATAVVIMGQAVKSMGSLSWDSLIKGLLGMATSLIAMVGAMKLMPKNIAFKGTGLIAVATGVIILSKAVGMMGSISWANLIRGLTGMALSLVAIAGATQLMPKGMIAKGFGLIAVSAAIAIIGKSIESLGNLSWSEIAKGLTGISLSLVAIAGATKLMPKGMTMMATGFGLIAVSTAIAILGEVITNLGGMSWSEIAKGITVLGSSMLILAVGLNAMEGSRGGSGSLLAAAVSLGVLGKVLKSISKISWGDIAKGILAIAGVFVVLGVSARILAPLVRTIYSLSIAMLIFGAGCALVGAGILAVSIGLSSLGVSLVVVASSIVEVIKTIVLGLGDIIVSACSTIKAAAPAIAEALVAILKSAFFAVKTAVPEFLDLILTLIEAVKSYTPRIVDGIISFIISLMDTLAERMPELVDSAMKLIGRFFKALGDALGSGGLGNLLSSLEAVAGIFVALGITAKVISTIPIAGAIKGILALAIVVAGIAAILAALGGLAQIDGFEWLIGEGSRILAQIGTAIGEFVGNIAGGFLSGVSSGFVAIGENLSLFMEALQPFLDGAKQIDPSVAEGIKSLAIAILALTASSFVESLASFFSGESSLGKLGDQLVPFGKAMMKFSNEVNGINVEAINSAAEAGKALGGMYDAMPSITGVISWFKGGNNLGALAEQLVPFGKAMMEFSNEVDGINSQAIMSGVEAGKALAGMEKSVDSLTGVVSWFTGGNNLGALAEQIVPFGEAMMKFSDKVKGIDKDSILNAVEAGKSLAEMESSVDSLTGVVSWFTGSNNLGALAEQIVPFGEAMVEFSNTVKGINSTSIYTAVEAGKALSEMEKSVDSLTGVVSWFTGGNNLGTLAEQLVPFGKAIAGFSDVTTGIDSESINNAVEAGKALAGMESSVGCLNGVVSWFTGSNNLEKIGEQLVQFGEAMMDFSDVVGEEDFNIESIKAATEAGKALASMNNSINSFQGIVSGLLGVDSMGDLTEKLVPFGEAMVGFSEVVSDEEFNTASIKAAVSAGVALASMNDSFTSFQSVVAKLLGVDGMSELTSKLVPFGKAMVDFSAVVSGKSFDTEAVKSAVDAGVALASMYGSMTNFGTVVGYILDMDSMSDLTDKLVPFGKAMAGFSAEVTGKAFDTEAVKSAVDAGVALAGMYGSMTSFGSVVASFLEIDTMGDLTDKLVPFGKAMAGFCETVSGKSFNAENVKAAVEAGVALAGMKDSMSSFKSVVTDILNIDTMEDLGDKLVPFGEAMCDFSDTVGSDKFNAENVSTAVESAKSLSKLSKEAKDIDLENVGKQIEKFGSSLSTFSSDISGINLETLLAKTNGLNPIISSLSKIATDGIQKFNDTFSNSNSDTAAAINSFMEGVKTQLNDKKQIFNNSAKESMDQFINGIKNKYGATKSAAKELADSCISEIKSYSVYLKFYNAGENGAKGFANGIKSCKYLATDAGSEIGKAALEAAKEALDENSPSKEFYKVGEYCGIGLSNALYDYRDKTYDAGYDIGDYARIGLTNAMSRIQRVIDNDIDSQPTIRPVLDLSNVTNGANAISGMLSMNPSIGAVSNIRAISTSMNRRIQNGTNNDVVSAIKDLGSRMGNTSGDTYQINGITYSSDSDVADAIKTLVRAARVERRV